MASGNDWDTREGGSDNPVLDVVFRVLKAIRGSFMYFIIAIGVVLAVAPLVPGLGIDGALAGLMGLWGYCAIIYGVLGRLVMRFLNFV